MTTFEWVKKKHGLNHPTKIIPKPSKYAQSDLWQGPHFVLDFATRCGPTKHQGAPPPQRRGRRPSPAAPRELRHCDPSNCRSDGGSAPWSPGDMEKCWGKWATKQRYCGFVRNSGPVDRWFLHPNIPWFWWCNNHPRWIWRNPNLRLVPGRKWAKQR